MMIPVLMITVFADLNDHMITDHKDGILQKHQFCSMKFFKNKLTPEFQLLVV